MKHLILTIFVCICCNLLAFEYTLRSGDYDIGITAHFKHTIRSITYKGCKLGMPNGFYGAIVIPKPAKYIGAGHSEGGLEHLLEYAVECDGVRVEPAKNAVLSGKKVSVEKVSLYDNVLLRCRIEVTPEGIVETKRFVTIAEQTFNLFYPHIFCINKLTTDFCYLTAKGEFKTGQFLHQKNQWHINTDVKYVAQYDAASHKGLLFYYPQVIQGMVRHATIWEVVKSYNKFYMFAKVPPSVPAGWESPVYTVCIRGFEAKDSSDFPNVIKNSTVPAAEKITVPAIESPQY